VAYLKYCAMAHMMENVMIQAMARDKLGTATKMFHFFTLAICKLGALKLAKHK
jgi:hypothetical protein